jgi:polygalacturonase
VHTDGGGRVLVPTAGFFISGSIFITLKVEHHFELAVLKASTNRSDYAFVPRPLFYYERLKNYRLGFNRQYYQFRKCSIKRER